MSARNPSAPSPMAPIVAPARKGPTDDGIAAFQDSSSLGPAPILVWVQGPFAPKDLYDDNDAIGWCYDAHGFWWEVFPPLDPAFGPASLRTLSFRNYYTGERGYRFSVRTGPPVTSGGNLLDQIADVLGKVVIPAALAILDVIEPEIGIVATIVYSDVAKIAAGASLSSLVLSTVQDAARQKIGSEVGKEAFDAGFSAATSLDAIQKARADLDVTATAGAADVLGLHKAFETGVALSQTKQIQDRAVATLRTQLQPVPWATAEWNAARLTETFDTAVGAQASPTDLARGIFPTPAEGLARFTNAIADATVAVNPKAAGTVKKVKVPTTPAASAGLSLPKGAPSIGQIASAVKAGTLPAAAIGASKGGGGGGGAILALAGIGALVLWLKGRR